MARNNTANIDDSLNKLNRSIEELVRLLKEEHKGSYKGRNSRYNPNYEGDNIFSGEKSWKRYYRRLQQPKRWDEMSKQEQDEFREEGRRRKMAAKREDASNELYKSGLGKTKFGRISEKLMSQQESIDNLRSYGKYLNSGGAKTLATSMFGNGKAGSVATKGLGMFGKALGGVTKLMGGPYFQAILKTITLFDELAKAVGKQMDDWKQHTTKMYQHQAKQEQLQYDLSKQQSVIENKMKIENVSAQGDIQMKMLETQSATMLEALKMTSAQYAKSVETAIGPLTKGINQSAYDAMRASTQFGAEQQKFLRHKTQRETEQERYEDLRLLQQQGKIAGLEAEKGLAETQYRVNSQRAAMEHTQYVEKEHTWKNAFRNEKNNLLNYDTETGGVTEDNKNGGINIWTGNKSNVVTNTNDAGAGNFTNSNAVGAIVQKHLGFQGGQQAKEMAEFEYAAQKLEQIADKNMTSVDMQYELATREKDYSMQIANKQLEVSTEAADIVTDTALDIKNMFIDLAQKTEQWIEKFDRTTNDLGKNLGYTNTRQLREFQNTMFENAKIAAKFGKTTEELAKVQQSYIESTGRNRLMGTHDTERLMALGNYLGDDGLAANYASEMEIFNAGVSDSVDMLGETLQDVNRIGLNGRKYTKTLVDNLKLAQKYNFKDGTKGLMNMAKWAENTRFNMNSLSGMLDKVSEGGLEGIIKQGAEFQVLGGHAAMNADPIAMWYERYADPQAFAKRMQDMTKGYGQLDKKTGETTFSVNEQMMMEQLAKIQGRSYEDVANEVRARNKKEVVAKQFRSKFNEEEQAFISNNATYNKETGQFQVKVRGANGKLVEKDVSQLTPEDLENIMPADYQGKMLKNVEDIVDLLGKAFGEEERERIEVGQGTIDNTIENQLERIAKARASFEEHKDEYIGKINEIQDETTKQFTNFLEMASKGNQAIDNEAAKISATASNINAALQTTADIIAAANAKIASAGGIPYTAPTSDGKLPLPSLNFQTKQQKIPATSVGQRLGAEADVQRQQGNHAAANGLDRAAGRTLMGGMRDGIVNNNNKPIVSSASNVTKINDGLVQSDPKDVAIFAKEGGVIGDFLADLKGDVDLALRGGGSIQSNTMKIEINGSLELSSGGQSINIINELHNDPIALRSLSRMLVQQVSSAKNGGKGIMPIGIDSV